MTESPFKRGRMLSDTEDEKTFPVELEDGRKLEFTLRRPSLARNMEARKEAARMLDGLTNADATTEAVNMFMATVKVAAMADNQKRNEHPAGWPPAFSFDKVYEYDWLEKLYGDFMEWVNSFRKARGGSAGSAESRSGEGSPDEAVRPAPALPVGPDEPRVPVADGPAN